MGKIKISNVLTKQLILGLLPACKASLNSEIKKPKTEQHMKQYICIRYFSSLVNLYGCHIDRHVNSLPFSVTACIPVHCRRSALH